MNFRENLSRYGVALSIWIFVTALAMIGVFQRYENIIYDSWFNLRGQSPPGDQIVIIGIDDPSYAKLGQPVPRIDHAKILDRLSEAKIVAFDMMFENYRQPDEDSAMAEAIASHKRVLMACAFSFGRDREGYVNTTPVLPIKELIRASRGNLGHINMNTDMDNTVRRIMPVVDFNGHLVPGFSLAIALTSQGKNPNKLVLENGAVKSPDGFSLPLDAKEPYRLINFWGPGGTFKTYSYVDVLEGKYGPETFRDSIVLLGPTSAFDHDYFDTPFTRSNMVLKGSLPTNGVEIHANALNTFLTGTFFNRAGWPVNLMVLFLAAVTTFLTTYRRGPWVGLGGFLAVVVILSAGVYLFWLYQRYWIDLAAPLILTVFTYIGITTENFVREQMEKRRTRMIFGRYVSPQVVSQLLDRPEMMGLGGRRENLTLLFSDIRGFTSFSDRRPPEEVVAKLNQYLTEMTSVIFKNGGTLDKYMGDGIMAFFGAPIPCPDHAERAMQTALEMLEALENLNRAWKEQGEVTLGIGVGISTGHVVVGNIGSPERMDYTVIGEDVNLASRLESLNKEFKTQIIISGSTYSQLDHSRSGRSFRPLGAVPVRGFENPVEIYTVENSL
ncbi:MAG: adenylate/guanylate cyclase domain-containing protein [Actinobacteria bacterium]|nr:adenylate/guanylate cyclase domain-containing protein [Actinomycetota bacterium]